MDNSFTRIVRNWMPLAVGLSAVAFIVYLAIQQDIRIGANDPQIQMAEDMASSLNAGKTATVTGKIDIAKSLSPFTIVYDLQGNVTTSNAVLNGKTPTVPMGVLKGSIQKGMATNQPGENRVTWQPQVGVRLASVVVSYHKGYVLVGRNMREIEIRESQQFNTILLGWMIGIVATFSCVVLMQTIMRKKK